MGLGERIKERIDVEGLTQAELARRVGITQPSINHLIKKGATGSAHLHKIARVLNTTPEYLTGDTDDPSPTGIVSDKQLAFRGKEPDDDALSSVQIPQLEIGYSMGGGNAIADYQQTAMVPFPREWLRPLIKGTFADLFVARGEGDSMLPTLLDGDLVIVDTAQKTITQQDRLWCLSYGDLGMIKRVRLLPDGGAQINSDNPAVTPITAYDDEMHVIGRVIWIGRRV